MFFAWLRDVKVKSRFLRDKLSDIARVVMKSFAESKRRPNLNCKIYEGIHKNDV